MEFKFTKEEEDIRRAANNFAQKELANQELEKLDHVPMDTLKTMGGLGFLGLKVPEEYGGTPASWVEVGIVVEEIAKGNIAMAYLLMLSCEAGLILAAHGSEETKREWLPGLCQGEKLGCISAAEPGSGSDFASLTTRATRNGDFYLLQGEKSPVSLGTQADFTILFAKTKPEAQARGITSFLVPLDLLGITKSPIPNMGLFPAFAALLRFDEVRIPATNLIGRESEAFNINSSLGPSSEFSQVLSAIISLGAAQSALSQAISYAKKRLAFGRPIAQFQAISGKIAEDATLIEMARWLCYRTLWLKDQGLPHTKEAAMCSWWCPKSAYKIIEHALLIHGHAGYTDDYPFQQMLRDIIAFEIIGGTENIMKLIIAEKVMGKIAIPDQLKSHLAY